FKLNFATNALFGPPTPINEYKPGFQMLVGGGNSSLALSIAFALLPWATAGRLDVRARILYGLFWLAGLLMFALAVRSLVVWWLLTIPLCALALSSIRSSTLPVVRTAQRAVVHAIFAMVAISALETWLDPALLSGGMSSRFLPSTNAKSIKPLAHLLYSHTRSESCSA